MSIRKKIWRLSRSLSVGLACFAGAGPCAAQTMTQTAAAPASGGDAVSYSRSFAAGVESFEAGRYEEALRAFLSAAAVNPEDAEVFYNAGATYARLGRHEEAAGAFGRALELRPRYAKAAAGHCAASVAAGGRWEAVEACGRAVRLRPDEHQLYYHYGRAFAAVGLYDQAVEAQRRAIRLKPDSAEARLELGLAYRRLGEYREALDSLERAVRLSGGSEEARRAYAETTGELEALDRELSSVGGYERLLRVGDGYRLKGWYVRAASVYRRAVRENPSDARGHYLEGLAFYGAGQFYRAADAYERASRLDPSMREARESLTWLNTYLRRRETAGVAALGAR